MIATAHLEPSSTWAIDICTAYKYRMDWKLKWSGSVTSDTTDVVTDHDWHGGMQLMSMLLAQMI